MKFITSRIVSSSKVKTLQDIIQQKRDENARVVTASAKAKEVEEVAAVEEADEVVEASVEEVVEATAKKPVDKKKKKEEPKKVEEVEEKEEVTASSKKIFRFVKVSKLQDKDRGFLKNYYERYYPAEYVSALLAEY